MVHRNTDGEEGRDWGLRGSQERVKEGRKVKWREGRKKREVEALNVLCR